MVYCRLLLNREMMMIASVSLSRLRKQSNRISSRDASWEFVEKAGKQLISVSFVRVYFLKGSAFLFLQACHHYLSSEEDSHEMDDVNYSQKANRCLVT
jgi:hypothetical protein